MHVSKVIVPTQKKMVCYLLHTSVCYFSNKCVKFLIQHTKRAEMTHYSLFTLTSNSLLYADLASIVVKVLSRC